jgi:hypothetical protein
MHQPLLQRIRKRPLRSESITTLLPGGGVSLDIGPDLFRVMLMQHLQDNGLRGKV